MNYKTQENLIRRKLARMGYRLVKSRRRDPDALDYGCYEVVDVRTNFAVFGLGPVMGLPSASLEEVKEWIEEEPED